MYESHCHTPLCKHAKGAPTEYAAVAQQKGLQGLIVTCHNPMPDGFSSNVRMGLDQFDDYLELVEQARKDWSGRVDVRLGLEADFFPGYESFVEGQLQSAEFHYVLGSVHPQIQEYRDAYWKPDPVENQKFYFEMLAKAAETRLFDCISHPDLIKNITAPHWRPSEIMDHVRRSLDRIAQTGTAMEVNTSGAHKTIRQINPFPDMVREMCERDIPVVIGADAHVPDRVGDRYCDALGLIESCGYRNVSYFLNRTRQTLSIGAARRACCEQGAE